MKLDLSDLPTDIEALQKLVREQAALLQSKDLEIERLTARIAKLRRMQCGRSSEKIDAEIEQLELLLDDLHDTDGAKVERSAVEPDLSNPVRRPLPEHLPRENVVHAAACVCPKCGGELRRLGEDVTEVLEYVPASCKVIRHMRPKFSCHRCEAITQASRPSLPIERGRPGPGLLARPCAGLQIRRSSAAVPSE
jgi:hypothetical protein